MGAEPILRRFSWFQEPELRIVSMDFSPKSDISSSIHPCMYLAFILSIPTFLFLFAVFFFLWIRSANWLMCVTANGFIFTIPAKAFVLQPGQFVLFAFFLLSMDFLIIRLFVCLFSILWPEFISSDMELSPDSFVIKPAT